jgi:hypothetical protein
MTVTRAGSVKIGDRCDVVGGGIDQGVEFNRDDFTRLLRSKGYSVNWQQATFCPNRPRGGLAPKDHSIDCKVCDGSGFLHFDECTTQMLMTGMSLNQNYFAYGRFDVGQVMVTALPTVRLHEWDRLVLNNGVARFHEIVLRQPETNADRLKYNILAVQHVAWMDRSGVLRRFHQDRDFLLRENRLVWTAAFLPDPLDYYTVAYTYRPRYVVMDLVHQHRESPVNGVHQEFPVQAVAKLEHLIRDESLDPAAQHDTSPFPES